MHLLVVPVEYEVACTQDRVAQNLLVCGENHAHVASRRFLAQAEDEVLQRHSENLLPEAEVNATAGFLQRAGNLKISLSIIYGAERGQNRLGNGPTYSRERCARVQHDIGVLARYLDAGRGRSGDTHAREFRRQPIFASDPFDDGPLLKRADELALVQSTVDDRTKLAVRVSQVESIHTAGNDTLGSHGTEYQAIGTVAFVSRFQVRGETNYPLRLSLALRHHAKRLVRNFGPSQRDRISIIYDGS